MTDLRTDRAEDDRTVVLVVEDEALIRINACDMLEDMGFDVVDAADGVEAIGVLEARSDIRLVFTDCRMPRMTGPELAQAATLRWPGLRVILATAYQEMPEPPRWPVIAKPYNARALAQAVKLSLAAPP